jgi:hypothetical protein
MTTPTPPLFINFTVPYNTTSDNIRTVISHHYTSDCFSEQALDNLICHFSMIPQNSEYKQAHIIILNQEAMTSILKFFNNTFNENTDAYSSTTPPPTGIWSTHIDTSVTIDNTPPKNCHTLGCKLHGIGSEPAKAMLTTLLESHGMTFHKDLLQSLPTDTLSSILCFTTDSLTLHSSTCNC